MALFRKKESGFTFVEVILVVIIMAIVGVLGYTLAQNTIFKANPSIINNARTANDVPEAPALETNDDLDATETTLDSIDLDDETDMNSLDSELSNF